MYTFELFPYSRKQLSVVVTGIVW